MPRLIHLNGMPRVGKSTLARHYADDHPGVLALDLDVLAAMVGGWREDFSAALNLSRPAGLALAQFHLNQGHDVIVPQLVTAHDQGPRFEDAARRAGADYVEVVLLAEPGEQASRLRGKQPATEVEARIQAMLEEPGSRLVDRIAGHLDHYLAARPAAIGLDTTGLDEDAAYARLLQVLELPAQHGD